MKPAILARSMMMRLIASRGWVRASRLQGRVRRLLGGRKQAILYFHQVDDPYSHLAVQKLPALQWVYRLPVIPCLVGQPPDDFKGDPSKYAGWALRDARSIAEFYKAGFPEVECLPQAGTVERANRILAARLADPAFAEIATEVGSHIWRGNLPNIALTQADCEPVLRRGEALRRRLGHYLGGMFYYDGEWYWGLDRLHLLESRLRKEGAADGDAPFVAPLPEPDRQRRVDAGDCTLEYFPSLRSPYTAVGHQRVVDLVARTGIKLELRPVIPMMMRGIPAPRTKRLYIMSDAAREARFYGVPFGRFVDPLGEPVKRAFEWYPLALSEGRGMEFVTAYLSAAFARGIDISTDPGLAEVLAEVGLDWHSQRQQAAHSGAEEVLQQNLDAMMQAGLWGVPSFRVSDSSGAPAFSCWGQDRIWRLEVEISRRAGVQSNEAS